MIKEINIKQLRIGMYVHELNCSWMDHPFASNKFSISTIKDLKKVQALRIKTIKIDTVKGFDIELETEQTQQEPAEAITEAEAENQIQDDDGHKSQPLNLDIPTNVKRQSLATTRKKSKEIKTQAEQAITNVMADVKLGQQVQMDLVGDVVGNMTESVLDNADALLGLSRIRNQDVYTFEHSVNIGVLMMSFAKSKGMSADDIHEVGVGGLLHDIGKTLTPPEILNKPAKLTDEEMVIMRRHVVDSRIILEKTPGISQMALDVAAMHHEKYDGNGYPLGLKGDEISEIGQMSAIVDVYDALTADRCYHDGQDPSVVLKRMLSWCGTHFNSHVMQEFIHCIGIYPPATLVMLNQQYLAVVVENNQGKLLEPTVIPVINTKTRETMKPVVMNLSKQSKLKVTSAESDAKWNINPQKYLDYVR
ncbi:MAG: HD-GYP domain-containing protein [Gammaproteobacteria bacterium]|nr:HD-GYP domain-containing protein [Gammaproteobacteria bacterium]